MINSINSGIVDTFVGTHCYENVMAISNFNVRTQGTSGAAQQPLAGWRNGLARVSLADPCCPQSSSFGLTQSKFFASFVLNYTKGEIAKNAASVAGVTVAVNVVGA